MNTLAAKLITSRIGGMDTARTNERMENAKEDRGTRKITKRPERKSEIKTG
jgi:hypothetical protein